MRHALFLLLALLVPVYALGAGEDAAPGDKGVADGTCWKDDNGNRVKAHVRNTIHSDQKVSFESGGDTSSEVLGTPASDWGCRESQSATVDGNTLDIKGGKVRIKGDDGKFRNMRETKDDECADDEAEEVPDNGPDTIGSLPDKDPDSFTHVYPHDRTHIPPVRRDVA